MSVENVGYAKFILFRIIGGYRIGIGFYDKTWGLRCQPPSPLFYCKVRMTPGLKDSLLLRFWRLGIQVEFRKLV